VVTEISTGVSLLAVVGIGLKFLNKKADKSSCEPIHEALNHDMARGEKKFDELTKEQQKQGIVLARVDERLLWMVKKMDNLNGGK